VSFEKLTNQEAYGKVGKRRGVIELSAAQQLWKVQLEGAVEDVGVVPVPTRHGGVEGIENALNLFESRGDKGASEFLVQSMRLCRGDPCAGWIMTGLDPKLLTTLQCPGRFLVKAVGCQSPRFSKRLVGFLSNQPQLIRGGLLCRRRWVCTSGDGFQAFRGSTKSTNQINSFGFGQGVIGFVTEMT
jgi:hypothetical protein